MSYVREEKSWVATPVLQGLLSISLMIDLYVFILATLIEIIFKIPVFPLPKNNAILYIIIIQTIILIINYLVFGYKKKYLKIIEKYRNESKRDRKHNRVKVYFFIAFSIIIEFVLVVISVQQHK